jgi:hypothetical protein
LVIDVMTGVNLIPANRLAAQRRRRRTRAWIVAGAGWAGLVIAACIGVEARWGVDPSAVAEQITQADQRITDLNNKLNEGRRRLNETEIARQTVLSVTDQPDWSILLAIFGRSTGEDIVLRDLSLKPDQQTQPSATKSAQPKGFALQVRGFGRTQPAVSQFVLRLQEIGLFDDVRLVRTGREPVLNTSAVSFEIACTIRESAASSEQARPKP